MSTKTQKFIFSFIASVILLGFISSQLHRHIGQIVKSDETEIIELSETQEDASGIDLISFNFGLLALNYQEITNVWALTQLKICTAKQSGFKLPLYLAFHQLRIPNVQV